jgi:hypothetical protein
MRFILKKEKTKTHTYTMSKFLNACKNSHKLGMVAYTCKPLHSEG